MKRKPIKKLALTAMLLAMALTLSIAESFIPFGVPGAKIGLANMVILVSIHFFGFWTSLAIDVLRVFIVSLVTGTFLGMGFYLSLSGALLSFFLMYVATRWIKALTPVGVSIIGAYSHSLAQIVMAILIYRLMGVSASGALIYYFPLMAFISLATGTLNGFLVEYIVGNSYLKRSVEDVNRGM